MIKEQRHEKILEYLKENKSVSNKELTILLKCSNDTVRRDITFLNQKGYINKLHGGISLVEQKSSLLFEDRSISNILKKQQIGNKIIDYISNGDTIGITSGTTNIEISKIIYKNFDSMTIVTNSIKIASIFCGKDFKVILPGGILDKNEYSLNGPIFNENIGALHLNASIICINALSYDKGLMDFRINEISSIKAILAASSKKYLAIDSTKFDKTSLYTFEELENLDLLFTDDSLDNNIKIKYSKKIAII